MKKLVVFKHSKYEWERKRLNLTHDELISKYQQEHANVDAIIKAHEHQVAIRGFITAYLNNSTFKMLDEIDKPINTKFDLVMVVGGDNSFTKVSHYVSSTPMLGINSDPLRSAGCMLRWSMYGEEDVIKFSEMLDLHKYSVEEWPRLETILDGQLITLATSEYYFGERFRNKMSRHVLVFGSHEEEQKCSGVVVATGSGSTGWFGSASSMSEWEPSVKSAKFVITEPYSFNTIRSGIIEPGKQLVLRSLNDNDGLVSVDSWQEFPFPRGSEARIFIGENPLNILIPMRE
jgi:NAD kinase